MLYKDISRFLGKYFLLFSLTLLTPLALACYYDFYSSLKIYPELRSAGAFAISFAITVVLGLLFLGIGQGGARGVLFRKEAILIVLLIWILTPAVACLPYLLSGTLKNPFHAYFEATSAITTTGVSVLHPKKYDPSGPEVAHLHGDEGDFYGNIRPIRSKEGKIVLEGVEAVAKPIIFWRNFTEWIGGLGFVVLFMTILPALGMGGKVMFHAETSSPVQESVAPRLKETGKILWKIYVALTLIQITLLVLTNSNMSLFDAICIAFSTLSTGGHFIINGNMADYQNDATVWIVTLFMFFGGINLTLYYYFFKARFFRLNDPELITYISLILAGGLFIGWNLREMPEYTTGLALRDGFFQFISALTTTGFATANVSTWPGSVQVVIISALFLGGMAGSTTGGMKTFRMILLFKINQSVVEHLYRPEAVQQLTVGSKMIKGQAALMVLCYVLTLVAIGVIGVFLLTLGGINPLTALAMVAMTINNSGMSFMAQGALDSFAFASDFALAVTSLIMILARLEFFTLLVVLVPGFWKQD